MTETVTSSQTLEEPLATPEQVDGLTEAAWELRRSDAHSALKLARQALVSAEHLGYASGEAYSRLALGYAKMRLSRPQEALVSVQAALELFQQLDDNEGKLKALNTLGIIYGGSSDLTAALKTFIDLQKLCAELGDRKGEADALNNTGLAYLYLGDFSDALEHHLRALKLFQHLEFQQGEVQTLLNIGVVYYELERYEEALEHFLKSQAVCQPDQDENVHALILTNLGRSYLKLGDFVQALTHSQESLTVFRHLNDRRGESYTLDDLGLTYRAAGRVAQARQCFLEGLSIKKDLGDTKGTAETCLHLGRLYLEQGRLEPALEVLLEGLTNAREAAAKTQIYKAHQALAEVYEQRRAFREACLHLKQYGALKDEVFNETSDLRLHGLQVRFEVEQTEKEKEIYRLKNDELAELVEELKRRSAALQKADHDKSALLEQVEKQAREDGLTGLYNRRYFDGKLEQEFARSRRYRHPLSVMICDIDNFKRVNDDFSHQMGDEVLRQVARILLEETRQSDTVARYGGEEFIVLFPETRRHEAAVLSERIRNAVKDYPWQNLDPALKVTLSMGVSDDMSAANHEKLVALADAKQYEAKKNGKNQVRV